MSAATAVVWTEHLRRVARADDAFKAVYHGHLFYKERPVRLAPLDFYTASIAARAIDCGTSLAITYPYPYCEMAPFLAGMVLVRQVIRTTGGGEPRRPVVLVTDRTEVRTEYLSLAFSNGDRASFHEVMGLARVRQDGTLESLRPTRYKGQSPEPQLIVTPRVSRLPRAIADTALAYVYEVTGRTVEEAIKNAATQPRFPGGTPAVYLFPYLESEALDELTRAGVPVWAWDRSSVSHLGAGWHTDAGDDPFAVSGRQCARFMREPRHEWFSCGNDQDAAAERRVWQDLQELEGLMPASAEMPPSVQTGLRTAYRCYNALRRSAVPILMYDQEVPHSWAVRPTHELIERVRSVIPYLRRDAPRLLGGYWESLVEDLRAFRDQVYRSHPKFDALVDLIHGWLGSSGTAYIVCPNQTTERVLRLALAAYARLSWVELAEHEIRLGTASDLLRLRESDVVLLLGAPTRWDQFTLRQSAAPLLKILGFRDEVRRGVHAADAATRWCAHRTLELRRQAWHALGFDEYVAGFRELARAPVPEVTRTTLRAPRREAAEQWSPFVRLLETASTSSITDPDGDETSASAKELLSRGEPALALRIEVENGACLYAEVGSRISVLVSDETDERHVSALRPGDTVVLVDGQQRRRTFDAILERWRDHSSGRSRWIWVNYWTSLARNEVSRREWSPKTLYQHLKAHGSKLTSPLSVRPWIAGERIGPDDPEDLRRMGEIFDDPVLLTGWRELAHALHALRITNRRLGKWLKRALVHALPVAGEDQLLDPDLGLYADDLRDAISLCRVRAVSAPQRVSRSLLGRLVREGE